MQGINESLWTEMVTNQTEVKFNILKALVI